MRGLRRYLTSPHAGHPASPVSGRLASPHPTLSPQQLPNLVLLYLTVARADAEALDVHERELALQLACQWAPEADVADVKAMVDTACLAARSGIGQDVEALVEELCGALGADARLRLLSDLGLMARADGHLTQPEAEVISRARSILYRSSKAC